MVCDPFLCLLNIFYCILFSADSNFTAFLFFVDKMSMLYLILYYTKVKMLKFGYFLSHKHGIVEKERMEGGQ